MYPALKHLHILFAVLSIGGFAARGAMALIGLPPPKRRWLRALPHINDTLLFSAGVALVVATHQYPFVDTWITVKLAAVLVYIALGFVALRTGNPPALRVASGLSALVVAGYIVHVALTKSPSL